MIIYPGSESFLQYKNKLLSHYNNQSPLYSDNAQKYYSQRPIDNNAKVNDKSFIIMQNNMPVILFLGAAIEEAGRIDIKFFEMPCALIELDTLLTKNTIKLFKSEINKLIKEGKGRGIFLYRDYLQTNKVSTLASYLLSLGATSTTSFWREIDLNRPIEIIRQGVRKSYTSLINWGIKELSPKIIDYSTVSLQDIENFRNLHKEVSGRTTRSKNSWLRQYEMVLNNNAFMVTGQIKDEIVSAGFFIYNSTNCYYGSSASKRDLFEKPLFHSLLWTSIEHSKIIGCNWFEVGEQILKSSKVKSKEMNISNFKAGFGGSTRICLDVFLTC